MAYTAIDNPELYLQCKNFVGSASAQSITLDGSEDMQPDFIWFKNRATVSRHQLYDSVRGVTKLLNSDYPDAEQTVSFFTSFDSDGFTIPSGSSALNGGSQNIIAWCWKAGGSASTDDAGTIDSSTSTSTTAGFSIATWTSTAAAHTIGHSLGVVPAVIIMKGRHESNSWQVYHHKNTAAPETDYLDLSTTDATADYTVWNDTAPTSTVMSLGTWSGLDDGGTMVAYIFAEKQGFSKFGSYTGNGNADGTFVYLGFRPAYVMIKRTSAASEWEIYDTKRDPFNGMEATQYANDNLADQSGTVYIDFVSNGFKWRASNPGQNGSGSTYIYMAFAEAPFVNSNGVPCNAR